MAKITKEDALRYHAEGKPGKIEVIPRRICRWLIRRASPNLVWKSRRIRWMLTNILLKETW